MYAKMAYKVMIQIFLERGLWTKGH